MSLIPASSKTLIATVSSPKNSKRDDWLARSQNTIQSVCSVTGCGTYLLVGCCFCELAKRSGPEVHGIFA